MGTANTPPPGPDLEPKMNTVKKVDLIRVVAAVLDRRYRLSEIKAFLADFEIKTPKRKLSNSIETYVRNRLIGISDTTLIEMAKQLGANTENLTIKPAKQAIPPTKPNKGLSRIKAFISYETTDVKYASELSAVLKQYNIDAFVAYNDAEEAKEFTPEIKKALKAVDFFISIHTKKSLRSPWCQQEIGFAFARDIKIIPINLGTNPKGFIKGVNAIVKNTDDIAVVTQRILKILSKNPNTKEWHSKNIAGKVTLESIKKFINKNADVIFDKAINELIDEMAIKNPRFAEIYRAKRLERKKGEND